MRHSERFVIKYIDPDNWMAIDKLTGERSEGGLLLETEEWIEQQELKHGMGGTAGQASGGGQQGDLPERDETTRK